MLTAAFAIALLASPTVVSAKPAEATPLVIASVDGNPITMRAYRHWMYVGARSENPPGETLEVPTAPPHFAGCIKEARRVVKKLRHATDAKVRAQCKRLFTGLNNQVLRYLIQAYW